jgi:hypothetical protein
MQWAMHQISLPLKSSGWDGNVVPQHEWLLPVFDIPLSFKMIGKLYNQDAVLGDQTYECDNFQSG